MTTHQTFQSHLTSWKHAVAGNPHDPLPVEVVAEYLEQFYEWAKILAQAKIQANKHGFLCEFNKGGSSRKAAWIKSGPYTLKVVFNAGAKRAQAVTETSREAYKSVDLSTSCEEVARAAIKIGVVTDNEVARVLNMVPSSVSARRNNIIDAKGITIDGRFYMHEIRGTRIDPVTKRRCTAWALYALADHCRNENAGQAELFG